MARRISDDFEEDLDDAGGVALLVDNRQLPLAIAISHACEKKGLKGLKKALKGGSNANAPFTDTTGVQRLPLHCVLAQTLGATKVEAWLAGKAAVEELLKHGATAEKRDANGRTALELLKSLPLSRDDNVSGKEVIVRQIAGLIIKHQR